MSEDVAPYFVDRSAEHILLRVGIERLAAECMATHLVVWECRRVHQINWRGVLAGQVETNPSAIAHQRVPCERCGKLLRLIT